MKTIRPVTSWPICLAVILAITMPACSSDDDNNQAVYEITLTNLTNNQPLSSQGYAIHRTGYTAWEPGQSASDGLELLAEAGDPSSFLSSATIDLFVLAIHRNDAPIPPGGSARVEMQSWRYTDLRITAAAMLVNTNDAFTGTAGALIGDLAVGGSKTFQIPAWDAGTEANTESAANVPGPAGGGEGLNQARDDTDFVYLHQGVVTADNGLAASALDESHRWDNPVAEITVTRIS